MEIKVTRKDFVWSYIGQFFSIGAGFITLPMILHKLSAEEVGFNYVMLAVGSIASLFDLGFVVQFGRNLTYVFSGANELQKSGVPQSQSAHINYHLLNNVIDTARFVYRRLSLTILLLLLSLGSLYVYMITDGFAMVKNSFVIWIIYCISIYFNIYFKYLESLLGGAALIKESKKATIYSRLAYILIAYALLLANCGLISVVVANIISPFISRYYSYHIFYTDDMKTRLAGLKSTKDEIIKTFNTIWDTTKMLALNMFGSFASNQAGLFIAGFFLSLADMASLGLMLQLYGILSSLSINMNVTLQAEFCKNRVIGDKRKLLNDMSFSTCFAIVIKIIGCIAIIYIAPWLLVLIRSNSVLPSFAILFMYSLQSILHDNMVCFCHYITSGNNVPFVKASLLTAFFIIVLLTVFLYMDMGIMGVVLGLLIAEVTYNDWYWPLYVIKEFNISVLDFYKKGMNEFSVRILRPICIKMFD